MSKMAAKLPDMAEERELAKKLLTALEGDQDVLTHLQVSYTSHNAMERLDSYYFYFAFSMSQRKHSIQNMMWTSC